MIIYNHAYNLTTQKLFLLMACNWSVEHSDLLTINKTLR